MMNNGNDEVSRHKQKQMLKLVTNSFYRELVNYGVDKSDIVSVSVNLLDFVTSSTNAPQNGNGTYQHLFTIKSVHDSWKTEKVIRLHDVSLKPLEKNQVGIVSNWLNADVVQKTLISFIPTEGSKLASYLFDRPDTTYFGIYHDTTFVGIIGAENVDTSGKKLEMKKFVGEEQYRSKGIGKMATFLFLYYAFRILNFNKVYLHSLDTNINNINLNSKFGFELEGILYKEVFLHDAHRDVLRMGLLNDKWLAIFEDEQELIQKP